MPTPGFLPAAAASAAGMLAEIRTELGDWRWADLPPAWVLVLLVAAAFLGLRWLYRRERGRATPARRLFLAGVRTLVLVALLLILSGPYREEVVTSEEKSHLVVLIDTSASMKNEDAYPVEEEPAILAAAWPDASERPAKLASAPEKSRIALVRRILSASDARILRRLGEAFVLHVFAFDEDWRSLGTTEPVAEEHREGATPVGGDPYAAIATAIRGLEARGPRTRIGAALRNVAAQFLGRQDQRFGGVVLITDGQDTSEGEPPLDVLTSIANADKLKVSAVGLGNPDSDKNLRVEPIRAKDVVLVRDQVFFETALRHKGFEGVDHVTAQMTIHRIRDAEGNPVEPPLEIVPVSDGRGVRLRMDGARLPNEDTPLPVRMWAPFDEAGTYRIKIEGKLPPSHERLDAILDDNVATHDLLVKDLSIRVLFVDRVPRYEWRFLSNYLTRESAMRPTGGGPAQRPRFLTHGLLQSADPTVDPPFTHAPGMQVRRYFPQTREELFAYDVLILGDVDLTALARNPARKTEVLAMIRSFVEEGGGIALEAGMDYKNPLDFLGTPLADLLPISAAEPDRKATDAEMLEPKKSFRVRLTEAGRQHPAFNILPPDREGEPLLPERVARLWAGEDDATALTEGWNWYWMYRAMGGLRPGATALAHAFRPGVPDDRALLDARDEPLVAFASMSFGRGRVFWSSIDDLPRLRHGQRDLYYGAFWEQVIRDLALYRLLGGNRRFKIFPKDEEVEVGGTAEVQILAQDERYQPLDKPFLEGVHVELPDNAGRIDLEGDLRPKLTADDGGLPGEYRFRIQVDRPGTYLVWIEQKADLRDSGGRAEERFRGVTRAREDSLKLPDHRVLQEIRRETDGEKVVRLANLPDLSLPAQTLSRVLDRRHRTQWDKSWVLFLIAGLLGLEWALRKRWQMI